MKTVTISFGMGTSVTKSVNDNCTVKQLVERADIKAALGHGSNVQAMDSNRRHLDMNSYVQHNQNILLETVANQKAAGGMGGGGGGGDETITITVGFGMGASVTKNVPRGTTIGDILNDPSWRTALGFGANVKALIDRVDQAPTTVLEDGEVVELETVANQKAA